MSRSDERVLEYSHPWVEQVVLVKSLGGAAVCLPGHVRCSEHTKPSTLLTGLAYCCRHPHDYERGASEGDAAGLWAAQGLHPHPAAGVCVTPGWFFVPDRELFHVVLAEHLAGCMSSEHLSLVSDGVVSCCWVPVAEPSDVCAPSL